MNTDILETILNYTDSYHLYPLMTNDEQEDSLFSSFHRHMLIRCNQMVKKDYEKIVNQTSINWADVYSNAGVDVLEKYVNNNVMWRYSWLNPNLPVEFYEKYCVQGTSPGTDKFTWSIISRNPYLPIWFFEKYSDKIDWKIISLNESIPVWFYEKNIDKVDWRGLSSNTSIPIWFFEKHLNKIWWYELSRNSGVPVWFFEKYAERVNWNTISSNTSLPIWFIEKYKFRLNWYAITANSGVPMWFLEKRDIYISIYNNTGITPDFVRRNRDRLELHRLIPNKAFIDRLVQEYVCDTIRKILK